jgi:hypothetical protein
MRRSWADHHQHLRCACTHFAAVEYHDAVALSPLFQRVQTIITSSTFIVVFGNTFFLILFTHLWKTHPTSRLADLAVPTVVAAHNAAHRNWKDLNRKISTSKNSFTLPCDTSTPQWLRMDATLCGSCTVEGSVVKEGLQFNDSERTTLPSAAMGIENNPTR